jgi:hypothetical protein
VPVTARPFTAVGRRDPDAGPAPASPAGAKGYPDHITCRPGRRRPFRPAARRPRPWTTKRLPTAYPAERRPGDVAWQTTDDNPRRTVAGRDGALPAQTDDPFRWSRKWSREPLRNQENRAVARFPKPSAGLEPATPSLPWQSDQVAGPVAQSQSGCTSLRNVTLQTAAPIRTVLHPPVPPEYLEPVTAPSPLRSEEFGRSWQGCA